MAGLLSGRWQTLGPDCTPIAGAVPRDNPFILPLRTRTVCAAKSTPAVRLRAWLPDRRSRHA